MSARSRKARAGAVFFPKNKESRMRFFVLSAVLICSCLAAGCFGSDDETKARTENMEAFSLDLPDGWQTNVPDGMQCTKGRCMAGFTGREKGSRVAVTVSVIPSLGKSLQEIASESAGSLKREETKMDIVSQTPERIEYRGIIKDEKAVLVATFDAPHQEVGVLLCVGEGDQIKSVVKSIRMTNPKLAFGSIE